MRFVRQIWPARGVPRQAARGSATDGVLKRRGWLPPSLRPPYLISLSIILFLMAMAIEILRQYSKHHDGLAQYKRKAHLSSATWRACINSPTAFALGAMLLWGVCAQDALRLEPYFSLASEHGAPASVLFINYRLDVGILAPIRAVRNRHYVVLCVSVMSLLMRIALPSLLSGLIIANPLMILERTSVDTWPHLVNLDLQESWYSAAAANGVVYGVPGGNNSEEDSSPSYAIAPVSIPVDADFFTMTLNQTVYWSSMTCSNVSLTRTVPIRTSRDDSMSNIVSSWHLPNVTIPVAGDSQCRVSIDLDIMVPTSDDRFQARHWEPMHLISNRSSPSAFTASNCPSLGLVGLIMDAENRDGVLAPSNVTTFLCEPVYQRAMAHVSSVSDSTIPGVDIYPSTARLLTAQEFSMHGLQLLMSSAYRSADQPRPGGHPSLSTITSLASQTNESRITLVGSSDIYGLAQHQQELTSLWNGEFIATIKKFFDVADTTSRIDAELAIGVLALMVVPKPAAIAEVILLLASCVCLCLAYRYHRSPSVLHDDPGSIAAQCASISRLMSPQTLQALSQLQFQSAKTRELRRWARGFWCIWEKGPRGPQLRISARDGSPLEACALPAVSGRKDPMPHFLMIPWFAIECVLLIGTIAAFGLAYRFMESHNLQSLTSSGVVLTVLFLTFGPTVISSIISSLFDSIHRQVSITDPWIRLRKGALSVEQLSASNQTFLSTLAAALRSPSSVTPAISALSFICLLNLVLILLCGGLFEPQQKDYVAVTPLAALYNSSHFATPKLQADFRGYDSAVQGVAANSACPPWTTMNYSAVPLETNDPEDSIGVVSSAATRGIGTELQCAEVASDGRYIDHDRGTMNWTYTPFDGSDNRPCSVVLPLDDRQPGEDNISIRYAWPTSGSSVCQRQTFFITASWMDIASASFGLQNQTALHCESKIVIQDYSVQFTPRGVIEESEPVADSSVTAGPLFSNASEALGDFNTGLGQFVRRINAQEQQHRTLYYQSYFPGRITANMYMSHAPGASAPTTPPDPHTLTQAAQSVYQATFSGYLSLRRDYFLTPLPPVTDTNTAPVVNGTTTYTLWGLMPSRTSMALIIAIIAIDVLALIAVFVLYYGRYDAPRVPKAPGSLAPWVAASEMLRDLGKEGRVGGLQGIKREIQLRPGDGASGSATGTGKGVWVLDYVKRGVEGIELDTIGTQSAPPDRAVGNIR
ncbi:hypothetical protein BJY00DRAFT_265805 [Aspergillus carlsbadensis]|nr:hypothetical protein BJY00DRAFT_265805 [Aspergillus carlsbadensis]